MAGPKVYITGQDVVITKATHPDWNGVVAAIQAAANQSYGSSTPRRVFWIAGEGSGYRWDVPDAFIPGSPSGVTISSAGANLEVYGVRNSEGRRPLVMPSAQVMFNDWSEARPIPHLPLLFNMSNSGSGRLLVQSIEARGCNILSMGTGPLYQNTPNWTRTKPQTVILRDIIVAGAGRVVSASFETPQWNYLQQRNTPNDSFYCEDCEFTEGTGTHLFYIDQIRASYFRRNKFAGANNDDMSAFRGVGMQCYVTDNIISDGNLDGTIQDKRDEDWWWNNVLVQWASKTFTGSSAQDTYVWPYRLAPGNESLLRVTVSGAAPAGGLKTLNVDYTLPNVGDPTTNVVLSPELTAELTGRTVTLNIQDYRIPIAAPAQPWRTSAQPLSLQHGQKMVVEGNTLIKSNAYGGSATFDFILWQKRWAWTQGHALPYKPEFGRRIWDGWKWENGGPTPERGVEFCDQWRDAYWQSITDAGIGMEHPTYERMSNPHINHLLVGPNTFRIGADPYDRAPIATYILKAESDYPTHTDAQWPRAYYAYGPTPEPVTVIGSAGQRDYIWDHVPIANAHVTVLVSGAWPIGGTKTQGVDYTVTGEGQAFTTVTLTQDLADQVGGRHITIGVYPYGPAGMQSRCQAVVWPQEGHTFEGNWGPVWNYPRTWTVGNFEVQSHNGLFNWVVPRNTNDVSNILYRRLPDNRAEFEGDWAFTPRIHLLQSADVPDGYPDWWQSKRDPEAGNPRPDYEHMIVDARNV